MTTAEAASIARGVERYADEASNTLYRLAWRGRIHFGLWLNYDDTIETAAARVPGALARSIDLGPSDRVLEIGAGAGATAMDLVRDFGCYVIASNISPVHDREIREAVAAAGLGHSIGAAIADAQDLPFADESFSVHWSQEVVVHIPRRHRVFQEAFRVLAAGGRLVCTEFTIDDSRLKPTERRQVVERTGTEDLWDRADYLDAMKRCGFVNARSLDWSEHLGRHFDALVANIDANHAAFAAACGEEVVSWNRFIWSLGAKYAHEGIFGWHAFLAEKT